MLFVFLILMLFCWNEHEICFLRGHSQSEANKRVNEEACERMYVRFQFEFLSRAYQLHEIERPTHIRIYINNAVSLLFYFIFLL